MRRLSRAHYWVDGLLQAAVDVRRDLPVIVHFHGVKLVPRMHGARSQTAAVRLSYFCLLQTGSNLTSREEVPSVWHAEECVIKLPAAPSGPL